MGGVISALLSNPGIGSGDEVDLVENPLICQAILVDIPALETRGATVFWTDKALCHTDADEDGVPDAEDNCLEVPNGPLIPDAGGHSQLDTDGYGNACDCDFNQDDRCNIGDFSIFRPDFQSTVDRGVGTDMDGNGPVGIADFSVFRAGYVAGGPGP